MFPRPKDQDIVEVNAFNGQELCLPSDEGCEVF